MIPDLIAAALVLALVAFGTDRLSRPKQGKMMLGSALVLLSLIPASTLVENFPLILAVPIMGSVLSTGILLARPGAK